MARVRLKPFVWLALILAMLVGAYAVLALVMVASLSVAPNYPPERARFNERGWGAIFLACSAIVVVSAIYLIRLRRSGR